MNYLQLVNLAIQESGIELDELTAGTWSSADAGRRQYPRLKRYVAEAWKKIQMDRDEWEFKTEKYFGTVNPQIRYQNGAGASAPVAGDIFEGSESAFRLEVISVTIEAGTWLTNDAEGVITFEYLDSSSNTVFGETFEQDSPGTATFDYVEPASYNFGLQATDLAEIQWTTFTGHQEGVTISPMLFVPWDNWFFKSLEYSHGTRSIPAYVSQDHQGLVSFYPANLEPFSVSFIYTKTPQILSSYDDEVDGLPSQYQSWIAWEALKMFATYDKNPSLFSHANIQATFYKNRAEKNQMPHVSWAGSRYSE